jgi:hypothetical protein
MMPDQSIGGRSASEALRICLIALQRGLGRRTRWSTGTDT